MPQEFKRFTGMELWALTYVKPPTLAVIKGVLKKGWWMRKGGRTFFVSLDRLRMNVEKTGRLASWAKKLEQHVHPAAKKSLKQKAKTYYKKKIRNPLIKKVAEAHVKKLFKKRKGVVVIPAVVPIFLRPREKDKPPS